MNTNKAIIAIILALLFVWGFPLTRSKPQNMGFLEGETPPPAELSSELTGFFGNTPALFKELVIGHPDLDFAAPVFKDRTVAKTPSLSDTELRNKHFSRLYPKVYLDYLRENQEYLISEGEIKPEDKKEFKNEDEVFAFLKEFEEYICEVSGDDELCDQTSFGQEIEDLKKLHTLEARIFENSGELLLPSPESGLWFKLRLAIDWFAGIEIVRAQVLGRVQVGRDDCYQGSGFNKKIGSNLITPCCACGLHRFGDHVLFVEDCRRFSSGKCNVRNFGCLNGPGHKRNAIWDSVSKICGFD